MASDVKGRRRSIYLTTEENQLVEKEARRLHASASYVLRLALHRYLSDPLLQLNVPSRKGTTS